jgi:Leucine-rich repeat (LRR) protein
MTTEIENWQLLLFSGEEDNRALALAMLPTFDFKDVANALAISYLKLNYTQSLPAITQNIQEIIDYFSAQNIDLDHVFNGCPICFEDWNTAGRWWSAWIDTPLQLAALDKIELLALGALHIPWILYELCLRADWHQLISIEQWQAALATWLEGDYLVFHNMKTLKRLPDAVFECRYIRGLRIYAPLETLQIGLLYQLQNLEALHLHGCQLKHLDIDLRRLPKLRALTFRGKEKLLKLNIEGREQLERLDIFGNPVMRLPLWVRDLSHLRLLNISKMNFAAFPPAVLALKNLEDLSLAETRFSQLPEAFAQMRALQHLDISGGHFAQLPDYFADLHHLMDINLSRCNFKEIPPILAAMPALRAVDIADNFIRKLDLDNLRQLFARLRRLNVRNAISTPQLLAELQTVAAEFPNLRLEIK